MTNHMNQQEHKETIEEILVNHYYDYKDAMEEQGGDGNIEKAISITDNATQQILHLIEKAKVEAELNVITAAWENSCTLPDANTISRSLASKRRYLEDKLATLHNQKEEQ